MSYGANNKPVGATYSNGMTETWTYNSDNTLNEVVITGHHRPEVHLHRHDLRRQQTPASEVWSNGSTVVQTETWNANGTINNVDYFDITSPPYTNEEVVYGANNKPAERDLSPTA